MRDALRISLALMITSLLAPGCPKKEVVPEGPPLGWVEVNGIHCYAPPDFEAEPNEIKRKALRQETWDSLKESFEGKKDGAVLVEERKLETLEFVLLGHPDRIEPFSVNAFKRCSDAANQNQVPAYVAWVEKSASRLSADDCTRPFFYEVHDFVAIQTGWHIRHHACKGDPILIEASPAAELYTVFSSGSPKKDTFHGVLGDPERPPVEGAPCKECRAGELLMRFEYDDGGDEVGPLFPLPDGMTPEEAYAEREEQGEHFQREFTAPGHGFISFTVNDDTYYDNAWYEMKGVVEYIALDMYPGEDLEEKAFLEKLGK